MLSEVDLDHLTAAIDDVLHDSLDAFALNRAPTNALAAAEALGLKVVYDSTQSGRARFVRMGEPTTVAGGTIFVRPEARPERLQWAIAHEIGEHLAWRVFAALDIDPREAPPGTREHVANALAGRLLLATEPLAAAGAEFGWDLFELKRLFATASHELIARRMLDFQPACVMTIVDQGRVTFRRLSFAGRLFPLGHAEKQCWQATHDSGEYRESETPLGRVRAWPVHEPHWKREIVRLDYDELAEGY